MNNQTTEELKIVSPFSDEWARISQTLNQALLDQFDSRPYLPAPAKGEWDKWSGDWHKETWEDKSAGWDNWEKSG